MIIIRTYVLAATYARLDDKGVECGLAASFYSLSFLSMFANMVACDLLRFRAPFLRLMLALSVVTYLSYELLARRNGLIAEEQFLPTDSWLDDYLPYETGSPPTVQNFIQTIDYSVAVIMAQDMLATFLRPYECAFTSLPCDLAALTAFYGRELHDRQILGRHRQDAVTFALGRCQRRAANRAGDAVNRATYATNYAAKGLELPNIKVSYK